MAGPPPTSNYMLGGGGQTPPTNNYMLGVAELVGLEGRPPPGAMSARPFSLLPFTMGEETRRRQKTQKQIANGAVK